ncbi:hypothetical protein KSF_044240 [Reticulibacter mediterranei]|uniref:Uncharacterized protein n=1 Tax=Reticulibacter mediterranei TaxID=2778369 RepID=A0A8J3IGY3_9CHLR|nr:hypothetical protein [Reticulibacter mediterranei]GHO94376.1 hypothetical protein KSF_044240 [Reticulibacter mediterranei]
MGGDKRKYTEHTEKGKGRGDETEQQSMGAKILQAQMQLERAKSNKYEFQLAEARRGRVGDAAYEERYQSWVKSRIEGMDQEIEKFTKQLEQMQLATTTDVPQTGPGYGYNPQSYAPGQGYSYGAVSSGGVERMGTIGRSQYGAGFYGTSDVIAGGEEYEGTAYEEPVAGTHDAGYEYGGGAMEGGAGRLDPTQRSSFVEAALREEQEQLAQRDMQFLAEENPDWLAQQGMAVNDLRAQRQSGQRRRRDPQS